MNPTIMALTARALLGRRRLLLLLVVPALLLGMTAIATATGVPADEWVPVVVNGLGLSVALPLTALIVGSSALGMEIEDGTITHVLTTPVPRSRIVGSKLLVAGAVTAVAAVVPMAAAAALGGQGVLVGGLLAGGVLGAYAYCALFLALSAASRRPVALGLLYLVLWENLLARVGDGAKLLSIQEHVAGIAQAVSGTDLLGAALSGTTAAVLAVAATVVGTLAAVDRLRSFSLAGETS